MKILKCPHCGNSLNHYEFRKFIKQGDKQAIFFECFNCEHKIGIMIKGDGNLAAARLISDYGNFIIIEAEEYEVIDLLPLDPIRLEVEDDE